MIGSRQLRFERGSGLLIAVATIAILTLLISAYFGALVPKYRSVHQGASWREAHQTALAGANYALQALNEFAKTPTNPDAYDWSEDFAGKKWKTTTADAPRVLEDAALPNLGGRNHASVTKLTVDVYTRHPGSNQPWFRVRSAARSDLPGKFVTADRRDSELRRMKLNTGGTTAPHVTRVVEAIARPRSRFARAITTLQSLSLGNSSNWLVDSFDSGDTAKSDLGTTAGGVYPSSAAKRQSNGGIATAKQLPPNTFGPLIEGNGAVVRGTVETVGGDNPATPQHENVAGSSGMDQTRIFDTFSEDFPVFAAPNWSNVTATPVGNTGFRTGNANNPKRYVIAGNLGAFAVLPPASGEGYVEILVNGNINIGNGNSANIVIPPTVYATLYVTGNIDFGNGTVNSGAGSSKVASHLIVYGLSTSPTASYTASGNAEQILAFYGPAYAIHFNGTVDTVGAVVGKSFSISGGGNGGFHYDEALGNGGPVAGWEVAGYFEDARADVE